MAAEDIVAALVTCLTNAIGTNRLPQVLHNARLMVAQAYWNDDLDSGSTIKVARLPKGASILAFLLRYEAFGAAVTAQIGDGGDDDRYVAAGGITTMVAAGFQFVPVRQGDYTLTTAGVLTAATVGFGYVLPAETDIVMKTGGADMDGSNHRMDIATFYLLQAD